jgi:hypothetical protein
MRRYIPNHYRYKSYTSLKKKLGEYDALVEYNELAIREFLLEAEKNTDFLSKLSEKHKIKVDFFNKQKFNSRIRLLYILSVSQQADHFFSEFRKEYKSISSLIWKNRIDGEADIDYILRTISGDVNTGKEKIGKQLYDIFNYYRLVRNEFIHNDNDYNDIDAKWSKIDLKDMPLRYSRYKSPKKMVDIDFDDFILYSLVLKDIAFQFCIHFRPNLSELALMIAKEGEAKSSTYKALGKLKNNPTRYHNAIQNFLNTHYGKFDLKQTKELVGILNNVV